MVLATAMQKGMISWPLAYTVSRFRTRVMTNPVAQSMWVLSLSSLRCACLEHFPVYESLRTSSLVYRSCRTSGIPNDGMTFIDLRSDATRRSQSFILHMTTKLLLYGIIQRRPSWSLFLTRSRSWDRNWSMAELQCLSQPRNSISAEEFH